MTFNIPSWPVLVLEDDEGRINWFRQRLHNVKFAIGLKDLAKRERNGERGRTRTFDPCLKRALLYQLSYAPSPVFSLVYHCCLLQRGNGWEQFTIFDCAACLSAPKA